MTRKRDDRRRSSPSPLVGEGRGGGSRIKAPPQPNSPTPTPDPSPQGGGEQKGRPDRIAKVMARAGLCSRRDAELLIAAGRVAINGATIVSPATKVTPRDRITIDGEPLARRERTRLFRYYKPVGLVSTQADPQGRPTLFDALPDDLPRLISVGRLDIGTEGLLLLTNDGGLARVLELPETQWLRRYRVRAHGRVRQADLDELRDGITIDGIHYGPIEAVLEREQGTNVWLGFAIREGKNREVRNVLAHLGLQVNRLIRVAFGPFELGDLAEGAIAEVETGTLRDELGARIVELAGCDFSAPISERRTESREGARSVGRAQPRDARRSDPGSTNRAGDERRPFRKTGGGGEKPSGRPRRGHAWRQDDAPLRRTYRGSRREDLGIADEGDKRTGLVKDRKGRRILVERFGNKGAQARPVEAPARPPRAPRRPSRDRASGPRPSRPKSSAPRGGGPRPPRKR
jgi:23S rRNA pseudouridine2605 synthase